MGRGDEGRLLEELGEMLKERCCSQKFLEEVRRLLLELELCPSLSRDPELSSLLSRVEELSSRLRDSYSSCRSDTPLREEWERMERYEFLRLKKELSNLREQLERRALRVPLFDLKELAEEMREEGAIREVTWALLVSSPCRPEELEREEVREAVLRLLRLFSEFRRRRGEGVGIREEKGALRAGGAR